MSTHESAKPLRYALVGAGAFGTFCIDHYRRSDLIRVVAVADERPELAEQVAQAVGGVEAVASVDALLARDDIDLVHLATPPFTHRDLAIRALRAGKHVLCEKPLATSLADAEQMLVAAREADRVLVVNLIMRYDPLNVSVREVIRRQLLGEPIAASLTNLAGDFKLKPSHWFWDPAKSGGIFVEHGVHFFDLFAMLLGDTGTVLSAADARRPGNEQIVEQVCCTIRHAGGQLAQHYHGFHQPGPLDRQELRIICERGDIRLHDWLTTRVTIDALVGDDAAEAIVRCFDEAVVHRRDPVPDEHAERVLARHKTYVADGRFAIEASLLGMQKSALYAIAIRELLEDQARYIRDRSHARRVTEANGLDSLRMAIAARTALDRNAVR